MITVLSGGTGTPKLLTGMKDVIKDFTVIVNTAEDVWISGNKICPDIDSVIYALAGIIDEEKWWGVRNDTFETHNQLKRLGMDEMMMIGDKDRATHIFRSNLLREGKSLKEATEMLRKAFGVRQEILPMCEEEVSTNILTDMGEMHFQEFWVKHRGLPEVRDIYIKNIENANPSDGVLDAIEMCEAVLIGPSNPVTSIMPILLVRGIKEAIKKKKVIAVSPIIGTEAVSGPAGKFLRAKGFEVSPKGVAQFYGDVIDVLIVDERDKNIEIKNVEVVSTNILMKNREDAIRLAKFIKEIL
uniref:2-phospho-L-lactate transferase n=1 Tax=Geoglobus ahangari TaxID=113653 RepID=A0A7C3YP26_9EURY